MFDNIAKSIVYFIKNATTVTIKALNPTSVVARMNLPDNTSGILATPLCSVRLVETSGRTFTKSDGSKEKYGFFTFAVIILGDTFTSVSAIKDDISDALDASNRIPIYDFAGSDTPIDLVNPLCYALQISPESYQLTDVDLPAREHDTIVFKTRIKFM